MQKAPLIAIAPNHWRSPWRNRQHLLTRLANRGWPVVYSTGLPYFRGFFAPKNINPTWEEDTAWRSHCQPEGGGVSVHYSGRLLYRMPRMPAVDKFAVARHARQLLCASNQTHCDLLVLFHPMYLPYATALRPRRLVYYCFDSLKTEWASNPDLLVASRALVERADLIVASSESIANELPGRGSSIARFLPNGADYAGIASLAGKECPIPFAVIPRPRIGYTGVLNKKIDYELIAGLAQRRTDWHWVLVGPEIPLGTAKLDADVRQLSAREICQRLPNVHFVGPLPYPDFAIAMHHMDVHVVCNRQDEGWWNQSYPLKFHEYLATGLPVLSSPINSLLPFSDVSAFPRSSDDWLEALRCAIEGDGVGDPDRRRLVAAGNDWDQRTDQLENWLLAL